MNKLNFPKDCNAIAPINSLPNGKYTIKLSTPKAGEDWKWSNGKTGFLYTAETSPTKVDGIVEAGVFAGSAVVVDGKINSEFTVEKTAKRVAFAAL